MDYEQFLAAIGKDRFEFIKQIAADQSSSLKAAITELEKQHTIIDLKLGYNRNDFIENGYTLMVVLRPKDYHKQAWQKHVGKEVTEEDLKKDFGLNQIQIDSMKSTDQKTTITEMKID